MLSFLHGLIESNGQSSPSPSPPESSNFSSPRASNHNNDKLLSFSDIFTPPPMVTLKQPPPCGKTGDAIISFQGH